MNFKICFQHPVLLEMSQTFTIHCRSSWYKVFAHFFLELLMDSFLICYTSLKYLHGSVMSMVEQKGLPHLAECRVWEDKYE